MYTDISGRVNSQGFPIEQAISQVGYGNASPDYLLQDYGVTQADVRQYIYGPEYNTVLSPDKKNFATGIPQGRYEQQNLYDQAAENKLQEYAKSTTDSPWLELTKKQIQQGKNYSMGQAVASGGTERINAREVLAQRKGGNTGAAERLAGGSIAGDVASRYGVNKQATTDTLAATMQERGQKVGVWETLPGMEIARARNSQAIQNQNIANLLGERQREYDYNLQINKINNQVASANYLANYQRSMSD